MSVQLEIVSPTRLLLSRSVDMVTMPAYEGDLTAMEQHAPMITLLKGGVISLYEGSNVTDRFFVAGGFAEITPNRCTILADEVVPVAELTTDRAKARVSDAEAAWEEVDKQDITARDAAMDRLLSAREELRVASAA
jgi:F-type H+-transporting ATPase subunit epsilon